MAKVKKRIKLSHLARTKLMKQDKKTMRLGENVIGVEYSEAVFGSKKEADKYLNSEECKMFMEVAGAENKAEALVEPEIDLEELDHDEEEIVVEEDEEVV